MSSSTSSSDANPVPRIVRRYLALYGLALLVLAGGLATLNIRVDPYDVFSSFGAAEAPIWGGSSTRMAKAYALRQRQPDCLLLGTSRTAIGYRSNHPVWRDCRHTYNAGLQKAHLYELRRYLQHSIAQGELRQVFLGLDFEMFRNTDVTLEDFSEDRLAVRADGTHQAWPLNEALGLAFSLDSTKLSLQILQSPPDLPWFLSSGDWDEESLIRVLEIRKYGVWETSRNAVYILRNLMGKDGAYRYPGSDPLEAFGELQRIIELCRDNGVDLRLAVNPVHASYHEMLFQLGLHDEYDAWKAEAGRVILAHAPQQRHWDFDRRNHYSEGAIPLAGDLKTLMPGFWDPSHFRRSLGDHVLATVMTGSDPALEELFTGSAASQPWQPASGPMQALLHDWLARDGKTPHNTQAP